MVVWWLSVIGLSLSVASCRMSCRRLSCGLSGSRLSGIGSLMARKTGPSPQQVEAVMRRSNGLCERCGRQGEQVHHRRPRGAGGTRDVSINYPSNLLHLCASCHETVEHNRDWARSKGFLVSRISVDGPADVPVHRYQSEWVLFLDDGGVEVIEGG